MIFTTYARCHTCGVKSRNRCLHDYNTRCTLEFIRTIMHRVQNPGRVTKTLASDQSLVSMRRCASVLGLNTACVSRVACTSHDASCFLALEQKVFRRKQLTRSFSPSGSAIKFASLCENYRPIHFKQNTHVLNLAFVILYKR